MTALTLKYRPKTLPEIVGQSHVTAVVKAMVVKDDLPPVLIFAGLSGSGKTSTARVLAAALNCSNKQESEPCGTCAACESVWKTNSLSVIEIDAASSGTLNAVHRLKELTYYAHEGSWRVIILDEAHSMPEDAFNVLLKALEEPPAKTVFVLATTEVFKIPDTIRTRSMQFEFRRISHQAVLSRLGFISSKENLKAEPDMLDDIAKHTKGSLRDAIMQLDQASRIGITTAPEFRNAFGVVDSATDIVRASLSGDIGSVMLLASDAIVKTGDAGYLVADLTELLRDLIILKAKGVPPCLPSQLEERKNLSYAVDVTRLTAAIKVLWSAQERVRNDIDQLTSAQIVCTLVADALKPVQAPETGKSQSEPITSITSKITEKPLSLAEMMQKVGAQS